MALKVYHKKSVRDVVVDNKRVIVRVDYNVPRNDAGQVTDLTRVNNTVPMLQYLIKILCALSQNGF